MARFIQTRNWEPFRDLLSVQQDLGRLVDRTLAGASDPGFRGSWAPLMDIHESEDAFTVWMDVPGMSGDDIEVTLDRTLLTIRGERSFTSDRAEEGFHRVERRYGRFERTVTLPSHVDADGIAASVDAGVLEVTIPKAEEARPRQIKVGTARKQLEG